MESAPIVLRVCTSCAEGTLDTCQSLVAQAGLSDRVSVRGQECLNRCPEPVAMAVQGTGRVTYIFDGLDPVADSADLIATLRTYLAATDGWIEDARPCGRLRFRLCARLLPPEAEA